MSDLLPWNATPQERALSAATARISNVPLPLRSLWNPDSCPPELLAWLAWTFSVDQWDAAWSDSQKREFIRRSVEVHRHKGTIGAVRDALAALFYDVRLQEWFNQTPPGAPYTFRVLLDADQMGVSQAQIAALFSVIDRTKNLRSHITQVELTVRSAIKPSAAIVSGIGSEINLTGFEWRSTIISENTIVI